LLGRQLRPVRLHANRLERAATLPPMSERLRVRPDAVEWRTVDGEIVALDLRRAVYLTINPSGTKLWPALLEGATREELITRLSEDWGIGADDATKDVDLFLRELADQDLLDA
jgi:hypothetical protein